MAFELKSLLFVLLIAFAAVAALAIWLDRHWFGDRAYPRLSHGRLNLAGALERAPFGLLVAGRAGEYAYANAEARRMLALEAPAGCLPNAVWRGPLGEDLTLADWRARTPHRVAKIAPERYLSWAVLAVDAAQSAVFLTDLSEQHRLERTSQLFLDALSHELRTPLTAILAHVQLLQSAGSSDGPHAASIAFIERETQRIVRLVSDLLDLTRLNAATELVLRPVDPLTVAEEAVAAMILLAEQRQIEVELIAASPLPLVLADADRLKQVVLNLLDNAVKYGRAGDRIEVRMETTSDSVVCAISDTGPGISEEQLPYVTQRLYRGRTDVPGSGLGLPLVREILRLHGSRLWLESRTEPKPSGTTLSFELARAPVPGAAPPSEIVVEGG